MFTRTPAPDGVVTTFALSSLETSPSEIFLTLFAGLLISALIGTMAAIVWPRLWGLGLALTFMGAYTVFLSVDREAGVEPPVALASLASQEQIDEVVDTGLLIPLEDGLGLVRDAKTIYVVHMGSVG